MSFIVTSYENLASVLRVHFLLSCHMLVFPSAETQGECGRSCLAFLLSAVPAWMDTVGTPVPRWAGQGLCLRAILSLEALAEVITRGVPQRSGVSVLSCRLWVAVRCRTAGFCPWKLDKHPCSPHLSVLI